MGRICEIFYETNARCIIMNLTDRNNPRRKFIQKMVFIFQELRHTVTHTLTEKYKNNIYHCKA